MALEDLSPETQKVIQDKVDFFYHEFGFCPNRHPFSAKVKFDDIGELNLKPGDDYYPQQWCETCQQWFPGKRPFVVSDKEPDWPDGVEKAREEYNAHNRTK